MREAKLERARRPGGPHGRPEDAALDAHLAARRLDDQVDRVVLGGRGVAAAGLGELLELDLEPRLERTVEPGGHVVDRRDAEAAGRPADDDEHGGAQRAPTALGARDRGELAPTRGAGLE